MMQEMPDVTASILLNNYNYERFLGAAIDSALAQSFAGTEVIVVDDGSTDDSRQVIEAYGERIVKVLKPNGGQASAFNAGFAASRGEFVFLLDADDLAEQQRVARVLEVFQSNPDAGWCFHPLRVLSDDGKLSYPPRDGQNISRPIDFRAAIAHGTMPSFPPATSGLCFRRALLSRILPMPEANSVFLSDHYLKYSALALARGYYLAEPLSVLRIHASNAYSFQADNQRVGARINVLTAYWTRRRFPQMARLSDKLMGMGMGMYAQLGGMDQTYQPLVREYLGSLSWLQRNAIQLRAFYHSSPLFGPMRRFRDARAARR